MKINEKYKDIYQLKINMIEQDIVVEYHNQDYVELFYEGNPRSRIDITVSDNELMVKTRNTIDQLLSINFKKGYIKLYVPKKVINQIDLRTISGNISSEIRCNQVHLTTVSGKIISKGSSKEAYVETVSGGICLYDLIENLKFKSTSGSTKCVALTKSTIIGSSISGSVIIANPNNEGYCIKFNSISGHFKDLRSGQRGAGRIEIINGNGSSKFEISTTSGNCKIDNWM